MNCIAAFVTLQEYLLGDEDHLTRDEFLPQLIAYKDVSEKCDSLLTVQAVFFAKVRIILYK